MNLPSYLPATVVAAVILFSIKECLEFARRRGADERRRHALFLLLARECELNKWTIKSLRGIFASVDTPENPNPDTSVSVLRTASGRPFIEVSTKDRGSRRYMHIPDSHRDLMAKVLLDVAALDKELFDALEPAYDGMAQIQHVRDLLLHSEEEAQMIGDREYLIGLTGYALDELQKAEEALSTLFRHCTGTDLVDHRLR